MLLLGNMDPHRLKENPGNKNDYHTHECKHCGRLMKHQWKVNGSSKYKTRGGYGIYRAAYASRHLENHCNEEGLLSIQQRLIKSNKIFKYEEDVAVKLITFKRKLL